MRAGCAVVRAELRRLSACMFSRVLTKHIPKGLLKKVPVRYKVQMFAASKIAALAIGLFVIQETTVFPALAAPRPWAAIQKQYENTNSNIAKVNPVAINHENPSNPKTDPWARLQAIFLPFTEQEEIAATSKKESAGKVSSFLHQKLRPYERLISEASRIFHIPPAVIGAVIMVESGGNPEAKAKTSTASGLMQTIQATFQESRRGLMHMGITVKNTPFDPEASIMAGSFYLSRMFERAEADGKAGVEDRDSISSWHIPAEYYYAGPGNGKKDAEKVIIYSGGRRILVDKPAYSQKVMRWAEIMRG